MFNFKKEQTQQAVRAYAERVGLEQAIAHAESAQWEQEGVILGVRDFLNDAVLEQAPDHVVAKFAREYVQEEHVLSIIKGNVIMLKQLRRK